MTKKNTRLIIILLVGIVLGSAVTYATSTYLYNSNAVSYDNTSTGLTVDNVQDALDSLFDLASNSGGCPEGYTSVPLANSANGYKCVQPSSFASLFTNAVADNIASTYVTSSTGVDFNNISSDTNGKGVYLLHGTENDAYPIYYYRGAVTNNNLLFANFCWKIVRTTETGGLKLIYNGLPSTNKCLNTTGDATRISAGPFHSTNSSASRVGYTYYDYGEKSSNIKTKIDTWYENNMTSYASYLEETVWCNDKSTQSTGSSIYYGGYDRLSTNKNPTLLCPQDSDKYTVDSTKGNGYLKYPIATLTADEVAYAGGKYGGDNSTFYLYTGQGYWLMTPHSFVSSQAIEFFVYAAGGFGYDVVSNAANGIRPAISLKQGTIITGGNGSTTEPYTVE